MLSTGSSGKSKPIRGDDYEGPETEDNRSENTDDKVRGYVSTDGSSFGGPQRDGRYRSRGRVTEYRHSRGRGFRGGIVVRSDRIPADNMKYHDSSGHGEPGNNKFYEKSDLMINLPEDPRISKLLRRLCAEVDVEKSLAICSKLQDAVMLPDNVRYIRRCYDILVESLLDILYDAPSPETKENAAVVLGRIGYIMGPDFRKHLDWIASTYSLHNNSIKHLLILSFSETFILDYQTPQLNEFAEDTLTQLQHVIEGTDSADVFMAAINGMINVANSYPQHFATHFVDTVDILVGWHVDNAQPKKIKEFALNSLLKMSRHWQADVSFSVNLLNQFIEDMIVYASDIDDGDNEDTNSPVDCMLKITSFLNVFKAVVKCLDSLLNPAVSQAVSWSFLSEAIVKIIQVLVKVFDENTNSELIISGNECIIVLLNYSEGKTAAYTKPLFGLISTEMSKYLHLEEYIILSILELISQTVKVVASNLPLEFIVEIIGPNSLLRPLRYSDNLHILKGVVSIYSNLLNLKNIPLLQETYKYVLIDIQNSYSSLIPDIHIIQPEYSEKVSEQDSEKNIIFYLQCLSDLANASNSIIGMWALQPSILDLLAIKLSPHHDIISKNRPALQYSILYLLYSHCKKNSHFIASSDLVKNNSRGKDLFGLSELSLGDVSNSSPTSGHLAIILNLISIILEKNVCTEVLMLTLNWVADIVQQLDKYLPTVSRSNGFLILVTNMIAHAHCFDEKTILLVLRNVQYLLHHNSLSWNVLITKAIAALCILHIDLNNKSITSLCFDILLELPWDIVQQELDKQKVKVFTMPKTSLTFLNSDTKMNSFKEYLMRCSQGALSDNHFKLIMNSLLTITFNDKSFLTDVFMTSWSVQSADSDDNNFIFFRFAATNYTSVFVSWALAELAQTCVTLKLRTVLGKPQETFMKIEGALKGIARETSLPDSKFTATDEHQLMEVVVSEQIRSRWVTEFMTFLEKFVNNAADGTAVVLPAVAKPVKTFFHTNWPTCREWLTRVRPAALAVSLYSGHCGAAIYHAQFILENASKASTNIDIEAITISLAKALIKEREPEVLLGLYVWIKNTFEKKFHWLKAAAEQANSKHENAGEYYKKVVSLILSNESSDNKDGATTESRCRRFIDEQMMDSYKHVQDWEEMQSWKEYCGNNNSQWNSFTSLRTFEETNDIPENFCNWDVLDFNTKEISKNYCSYPNMIHKIESTLVYTAVDIYYNNDIDKHEALLNNCDAWLKTSLIEFARSNSVHFMKEVSVLQLANNGLKNVLKNGKLMSNPFQPSSIKDQQYGTEFENLSRILWWSQYFTRINTTEENLFYTECLRLQVIKSARKTFNFSMAKRELLHHFKSNSAFEMCLGVTDNLDELGNVLLLSHNSYELDIWSLNNLTALIELSKLKYAQDETKNTAINLCANIALSFSQRLAIGDQSYELREKGTRMLLTLSKWVQNEYENNTTEGTDTPLGKLVSALPEIGLVDNNISENVIPISDSAVGKILQFSVNQCPGLAKAWANFASWCFRWGRKMVEYSSKTGEKLTDNDKLQIESVMIGCSPKDFTAVCEILSRIRATYDDDDIDWNEINTSEMIERQLRAVPSLSNAYPEHLALLVDIWRQAQKRVFSYFELSADAYFKFLQLICASDYINHSGEYAVVSATLRLLRLIVKHAMELQTVLESGLANTPTQPWKVIIPQLFSRLNHPETYVRKCVSDLLCRLAEDTPHLITFPAVVGAFENEQNDLTELSAARSFISNPNMDIEDNVEMEIIPRLKNHENDLNSCFLDMVETLSKQAPTTILQVKLFVKELQRINLLWDELWLGTLVQHHSDFCKRLNQLEAEILKVKENKYLSNEEKESLIKEKHHIIFDPILFVLEQINNVTSAPAQTPHEISFQTRFQILINEVIDKLKNPTDPEKPQESWQPLKQLQIKLQQKVNKRTSYILKMSDISPTLAELSNTVISMPGLHSNQRTVRVTIKSIENNVAILPTKTRPKKLVFYGSDGKSYTYLFKGLEDLHLDERIMQLLSITNTMLARDSENNDNQTYRARHYSVIPLGPRSGLISWVENVTPLFALYKRWQNREAALVTSKTNKPVNPPRPSELFYMKLTPLLREAGVSVENRKEWPASALKQVLTELSAETPKDLLWRELWCSSVTADQWWQMSRRYCYSVAVMSIIGYIIGLGDRHLDNVLVDLTSGELVHIDYNVCFEKGKTLRVPEKVPFRMTPNLVTALGVTGVEGIFRLACEHVLRTMRRGRETLLTLLEAFVYDPLVEWGSTGTGANKKKRTQRDAKAALAMLSVRAVELKHQLTNNTEQFMTILPEIRKAADNWLKEHDELNDIENKLQMCHQQMALIKEIEAYGPNLSSHPLYAISAKYGSYKKAKNAVEDAVRVLSKVIKEYDEQIQAFAASEEILHGPQLLTWIQKFSDQSKDQMEPIFIHVKDFLTNAGQAALLAQCEQAEAELRQISKKTTDITRTCLDVLSKYVAISQYYPKSRTDYHQTVMFRKWVAAALESKSPEVCREAITQINAFVNANNVAPNSNEAKHIIAYNYRLQSLTAEASARLNKIIEKLHQEGGPEAVVIAQEEYREAKANISNWIRTEEGAASVLESEVISMLCNLNKKYQMLESGAQSAGDLLADLTSREGEWFLDDMAAVSTQAVELLTLLPLQSACSEDHTLAVAVDCVRNANLLLTDLVQLNYDFNTIILPEALKKTHSEDPSTLSMIGELNSVIINTPMPLNELIQQLEIHLRYLVMDMEAPPGAAIQIAVDLRARYEQLLSPNEEQSPGKMLLMGFNGLFEAIELRNRDLAEYLSTPIPAAWRKIDQISDAMHMSAALQNDSYRVLVSHVLFVRRVQTVAEVLSASARMGCSFKGNLGDTLLDQHALCKPLKRFTAEFVSRCTLGVLSRALASVLCLMLRRAGFDVAAAAEQKEIGASWSVSLCALCNVARPSRGSRLLVRASCCLARTSAISLARQHGIAMAEHKSLAARLMAHDALHHQVLGKPNQPSMALSKLKRDLFACYDKMAKAEQKVKTLLDDVRQRVKWGAGANPSLCGVGLSMERWWIKWREEGRWIAMECIPPLSTPNPPSSNILSSLTTPHPPFNSSHEALLDMLHPEGHIDTHWVWSVCSVVSSAITTYSAKLNECSDRVRSSGECLTNVCANIVIPLEVVSHDLPQLCATAVNLNTNQGMNPASEYLTLERRVTDLLTLLGDSSEVEADKLTNIHVQDIAKASQQLIDDIPALAETILQMANSWSLTSNTNRLVRQKAINNQSQATNSHGYYHSVTGAGVCRKVRNKLEGKSDSARIMPSEQVEMIIREAMSVDNLSAMYEGWMAWV